MSLLFANDLCSAYTVEIVRSFQAARPNGYLGRTALQKLVYFCKSVGVPIPCSFEIYNFGPYSEDLTRSVNYLLADEALDDVSPNPSKYSSYRLGPCSDQIATSYAAQTGLQRPLIDSIVAVLGDSSPADLELVATLHFVNSKRKGLSGHRPGELEVLQEFRSIKGDKFSSEDIKKWYGWLDNSKLL
jgi:uncharacterized protein YwgA